MIAYVTGMEIIFQHRCVTHLYRKSFFSFFHVITAYRSGSKNSIKVTFRSGKLETATTGVDKQKTALPLITLKKEKAEEDKRKPPVINTIRIFEKAPQ